MPAWDGISSRVNYRQLIIDGHCIDDGLEVIRSLTAM